MPESAEDATSVHHHSIAKQWTAAVSADSHVAMTTKESLSFVTIVLIEPMNFNEFE